MPSRPPDEPILTSETYSGEITSINHVRGFGWISLPDDSEFFFHATACNEFEQLAEGDQVTFQPTVTVKGPRAIQVRRIDG